MKLDVYKELSPVLYGQNDVKMLEYTIHQSNKKCFTMHWHNRIEIIVVTKGGLKLFINNEYYILEENETAFVLPEQLHEAYTICENTEYFVLMFDLERFQNSTYASQQYINPIIELNVLFESKSSDSEIYKTTKDIYSLCKENNPCHILSIHSSIFKLLSLMFEKCNPKKIVYSPAEEKFGVVIKYINDNYTEKISTKLLSEKFGYDEAYFCRKFKKITGITAIKYINILRLEYAKQLLNRTTEEISDIAQKCGFTDICYFTQSFHTHFGLSPTAFRKYNRKK